jgi:hypothetical protein
MIPRSILTTPRPVPGRLLPAVTGGAVLLLALPVFLIAGWRIAGWGLGAVLWAGSEGLGYLLTRLRLGASNLAGSGVVAFGMMFRAVAVMVAVASVAVSDARLALSAALVYALAYTFELGISIVEYFGSETR